MSGRLQTVTILQPDGRPVAVTRCDRPEDAIDQFRGALQGAGHHDTKVEHHLATWIRVAGQGQASYEVLNPDLQGSVRISITQPRGG